MADITFPSKFHRYLEEFRRTQSEILTERSNLIAEILAENNWPEISKGLEPESGTATVRVVGW